MATPPPPSEAGGGPDPQRIKEIENVRFTLRKLKEGIEELDKQSKDAKTELTRLLSKGLAAAPLTLNAGLSQYRAWKQGHAALEANRTDAKDLKTVIDTIEEGLKRAHPDAFTEVLRRQAAQLEKEAAEDEKEARRCKEELENLRRR